MLRRTTFVGVTSFLVVSSLVQAQEVRRFGGEFPRMSTRIAYFGPNSSEGQLAIDYGQPEWKPEYETQFDELTKGKRWRLGNNFWTTLDAHLDLVIAGTEVEAGYYYLVLKRSEADEWHLVLLDPKEIQAKKMDAFMAEQTTGGIEAPLTWERLEGSAQKLEITLLPDENDLKKARLEIRWGMHKLSAPIEVLLKGG
jgi:hypothetical protein